MLSSNNKHVYICTGASSCRYRDFCIVTQEGCQKLSNRCDHAFSHGLDRPGGVGQHRSYCCASSLKPEESLGLTALPGSKESRHFATACWGSSAGLVILCQAVQLERDAVGDALRYPLCHLQSSIRMLCMIDALAIFSFTVSQYNCPSEAMGRSSMGSMRGPA